MEAGSEEEVEGRTSRQTAGGGNGRGGSFHGLHLLPPVNDAALMISLGVSGCFCTVRSPPYIIIWISFMLIMA